MKKVSVSAAALILANLVPVVGVLFFDWDDSLIIALFWVENLIIGAFYLLRMFCSIIVLRDFSSLLLPVFFIFHYGMFCSIHGIFLWSLLGSGESQPYFFGFEASGIFDVFADGLGVLRSFLELHQPIILLGILGLVLSRLVAFIEHFIVRGEVYTRRAKDLMTDPYAQILIMHGGIIFGTLALEKMGSPIWLLLVIVGFKVFIDLRSHLRRHAKAGDNKPDSMV